MKFFPHPLVLKIIDDFVDSAGHLCIVKDRYLDGNFSDYLKKGREPFF